MEIRGVGAVAAICKLSISDAQHAVVLNNGMYAENAFRRLNKKCDSSRLFARCHNARFITTKGAPGKIANGNGADLKRGCGINGKNVRFFCSYQ